VSTKTLIASGNFEHTIKISKLLLQDKHHLIHKAVGWMLREMGDKDKNSLMRYLTTHSKNMPRTALRYAIEKLPEEVRKGILRGDFNS
jgi:3-methyladenine DNA glycosylase AlkD